MNQATTKKKRHMPFQGGVGRTFSSHAALMQDMREFQQEVTSSPAAALDFLKRAGLVTASGKPKQLIRG